VSEHMSDTKNFEVITAAAERLSVSPGRRYRTWSREEKERVVGETFLPGANVSAIARTHGLDPSQLFAWRRKAPVLGSCGHADYRNRLRPPLTAAARGSLP
jgi:transposase